MSENSGLFGGAGALWRVGMVGIGTWGFLVAGIVGHRETAPDLLEFVHEATLE